ncbi:MAG: hypothetical protein AAF587_41160 [Bacteroidota bacterium]
MLRDLHSSLPKWQHTFAQPTLKLEDAFYYSDFLSFETLTEMVWYLSDRYLGGSAFHIRLETTNGDTYLALKFRELRYFFQQQRNKLWMLDLYSASYDGQQLFLRLWFHPLSKDPNAHVQLVSQYAEEILEVIHHTISKEPPASSEQACLHRSYVCSQARFDILELVAATRYISEYMLDGVHTVGYLSTYSGLQFSGLSRYQLLRLVPEYQDQLKEVSIGMLRLTTGQSASVIYRFQERQGRGQVFQSIMWGDPSLHNQLAKELEYRLRLTRKSVIPDILPTPSWVLDSGLNTLRMDPLGQGISSWADRHEISLSAVQTSCSHKAWEERLEFMRMATVWLVDLTVPTPEKWYFAGIAQILGKQLVLLSQSPIQISTDLQSATLIQYSPDETGITQVLKRLEAIVH